MNCHMCRSEDCRVIDTRPADDGRAIRRRRQCQTCGHRFSTVETSALVVVKRSGVTEDFDRSKVETGLRKACQGRPVRDDQLAKAAQGVEQDLRALGTAEVPSDAIGLAVLPHLHRLDAVAYLRFASVYKAFDTIEDFQRELDALRAITDPNDCEGATP